MPVKDDTLANDCSCGRPIYKRIEVTYKDGHKREFANCYSHYRQTLHRFMNPYGEDNPTISRMVVKAGAR